MSIGQNSFICKIWKKALIILSACLFVLTFCHAVKAHEKKVEPVKLTPKEKKWIAAHSLIRLAPEANYPPFIFSDKSGEIKGLSADYAALLENKLGLKFSLLSPSPLSAILQSSQKKETDVITSLTKTPERQKYLSFSEPYINVPTVIIIKRTDHRNFSLTEVSSLKIAVGEGYGVQGFLKSNYPHLNIIGFPDDLTGLQKLSFSEVDAVVMDIASASYFIEREGIFNLKIAGQTDFSYALAFAVRNDWPELIEIFNKALRSITDEDSEEIRDKWIHLKAQSSISKEVLYAVVLLSGCSIIFVCFVWYSNRKLKREINERKRVESELKNAQDGLEIRIAERTAELQNEITERKQVSEQLQNIKWLLEKTIEPHPKKDQYDPPYGNLVALNTKKILLDSVSQATLLNIVGDFLDLLESSSAVYEKNGDYALGIFSSGWCRFLDNASRNLCSTDDNQEALDSGLWLCHESCWNDASKTAIETGQPTDIECHGGIRLYALPIRSGNEIVGAINFGYGAPPKDRQKLIEIAKNYNVPFEQLHELALSYKERPQYILEIAKKRLHTAARLIGEIVERKQFENKLQLAHADLEQRVQERTIELRKSKDEWEKTFNAMSDIITIQDKDMRILKANKAAHDAFQVEPGALNGKYCYEVFRQADKPCTDCPELSTLSEKTTFSANITHKNLGKIFHVTSSPVLDDDGEFRHIVHIAKDITEQKKMENELFQAHKMEAIGTLAGGIAHDFNNILAAIIGYADMAQDEIPKSSPSRNYVKQVLKAGNRAKDLVRQILTFSRKGPETQEPLQPSSIIKEGLKMMRASLPTTIEMREEIDPGCKFILANPTNIHQILVNLCTNALHAMEDEKGILTIKLTMVELTDSDVALEADVTAGTFVKLTVGDTGCGMNQETLERIFEPYYTTKEVGKGSGMGLALVHAIVLGCRGFIRVKSEIGKGTTLQVYFPAIDNKIQDVREEEQAPAPRGNERILAVDDEQVIVGMYHAVLGRLGYRLSAYTSSEQALEVFTASPDDFDLVITDQTMPKIDGSELAKKILQIRPDMPIILCTGFSAIISEERAQEIGIKRFLLKPVSRKDLAVIVRDALDEAKPQN